MQKNISFLTKNRTHIRRTALALIGLAAAFSLSGCEKKSEITFQTAAQTAPEEAATGAEVPVSEQATVVVHVCGAVLREGVYTLKDGARVIDAVNAAGGFTEDADTVYVNQAALVTDGSRLLIPTTAETEALSSGTETESVFLAEAREESGKVNINTASAEELRTINGIGPGRAADIIRYREEHGAFTCIEDIMKVSGIKEKLFATIKDYIRV